MKTFNRLLEQDRVELIDEDFNPARYFTYNYDYDGEGTLHFKPALFFGEALIEEEVTKLRKEMYPALDKQFQGYELN